MVSDPIRAKPDNQKDLSATGGKDRGEICAGVTDEAAKAKFISLMNSKARSLGLTSTHYVEPAGYDTVKEQRTTARDMLKLALQANGYHEIA